MSDFKPMLPKDMDVSKVNFSYAKTMPNGAKLFFLEYDGSPIYIQSPEMPVTFDPQVFEEGPDAKWGTLDALIINAADELFKEKKISDTTWKGLKSYWDDQQMMDLVFAVGQYTLVSMALRTFEVPLDDFLTGWDEA